MAKKIKEKKNNEEVLLELVEDALLKRATGYEDASGKAVPPDVRAAMYWLENRCPERWKKQRNSEKEPEIIFTDEENDL